MSYLQVLAILSFEKQNHEALKSKKFLEKLEAKEMFKQIFKQFEDMIDDDTQLRQKDSHSRLSSRKNNELLSAPGQNQNDDSDEESKGSSVSGSQMIRQKQSKGKKRKSELTQTRQVELALSISIILSNLSNDESYIETLLGVNEWSSRAQELPRDVKQTDESGKDNEGSNNN